MGAGGPDVVIRADAETGEGPVWDDRTGELVWVDIPRGILHRSDVRGAAGGAAAGGAAAGGATAGGAGETAGGGAAGEAVDRPVAVGMMLGVAVPDSAAGWAVAVEDGFGLIDSGGRLDLLDRALPDPGTRMNDGACDLRGRMWAGSLSKTFDPGGGKLHRWTHGQPSTVMIEDLTLPNGIGWNGANTVMYLVDTVQATVFGYEFDLDDGRLGGRRALIEVPAADGQPDGLCVDADGCLWVAHWGGWRVCRYDPRGRLLRTVEFPVAQPSSCAFGPDTTLYVTSAREGLPPGHGQELAGSVFAFDAGVRGAPVGTFRL
jgi:sugar lactone lactonase YvrE